MRGIAEKDARGIGKRSRYAVVEHAQLAKQPDLARVEGVIPDIRAGEVAHQEGDAMVLALHAQRQSGRLIRGNAEPVHAGVDMDRRPAAPVLGGDESIPFRQLGRAVDDRPNVQLGKRAGGFRRKSAENVNVGVAGASARATRLRDVGHEEGLAACFGQFGGDRLKSEAVCVGLDHRRALGGEEFTRQRAPVRLDGVEIDSERAAGLGVGAGICQFGQWFCESHPCLMAGAGAAVKRVGRAA